MKKFVNGEAQNIAVNNGHPRDSPVLCARADEFIERFDVRERSGSQTCSEGPSRIFDVSFAQFCPVGANYFLGRRAGNISRKEHLQGTFACLTTGTHITPGMKEQDERMKLMGKHPKFHPSRFIRHPS